MPLLLVLLLMLLTGTHSSDTETGILLNLKSNLTIPETSSGFFSSWSPSNSACSFTGIQCDTSNSSVTGINLNSMGILGNVYFSPLCSLPSLTSLSLGANNLTGELAGIQNCVSLTSLDLAFNYFYGEVPDLSLLIGLRVLNISDNRFSGPFPWAAVTTLAGLQVLSIGDNPFAPARLPNDINNLKNLTWLYLSDINLYGEIPGSIGELTELRDLELSVNYMNGTIPPEITRLTKLYQLELYNNNLTGELPVGFGNLTELEFFDASSNFLSGNLSELRFSKKLVSLQLFFNNFSGEVPAEFGDFRQLVNLSLYSNWLTGSLPASLGKWAEFNFIDVSDNFFTGEIPPEMCAKGTMVKLLVLQNNFSGEIPATYANCTTLERFRVSHNQLTGEVPDGIWSLPNVNIIDLAGNNLTGSIGSGIAKAKSLYQLYLANNSFFGTIPEEIAGAAALVSIDASNNHLSGEIPASIGELKSLDSLGLAKNKISGPIPASIGKCSSVSTISLAGNDISGPIPASIGDLSRLNSLDLSSNSLSGQIPASLAGLKLSYLNLTDNLLTGPVPSALSIAGYSSSFVNNPGLCAMNSVSFLQHCSAGITGGSMDPTHIVITCLLVSVAVVLLVLGTVIYLKKQHSAAAARASSGADSGKVFGKKGSWNLKSFRILTFDEHEIVSAVKEENLIGTGGSGNVYRVKLHNGTIVAVKHIVNHRAASTAIVADEAAMLGKSASRRSSPSLRCREFEAEVGTLSSIRHVNVVKLYCSITSDEGASLLVYEYLPNGSLYDRLHTPQGQKLGVLDWLARYDIALGAAKGLEYLHHGCARPILHRDVKSSNILLDECLKPRIADFGLAKIRNSAAVAGDSSAGVVAGTLGYMAPEYGYTWKVTEKSDVYSFGVVLLELVTGRMPIEAEYGESKDIVCWVSKRFDSKEMVMSLLDKKITENWAQEEAVRVLRAAVLCTSRLPSMRPSMRTVVQMLEEAASYRALLGLHTKDHKVVEVKMIP